MLNEHASPSTTKFSIFLVHALNGIWNSYSHVTHIRVNSKFLRKTAVNLTKTLHKLCCCANQMLINLLKLI